MKTMVKFAAGLMMAAALVACGGGDGGGSLPVATANTTATINPTTGPQLMQALNNASLSFPGGVPALGTTTDTNLTISNATGGTPTFNIAAGADTASGTLGFGSCKFTITAGTGRFAGQVGQTITVSPCEIEASTAGQPATGLPVNTPVSLVLGTGKKSVAVPLPVIISPTGTVQLVTPSGNTISVGTITVAPATGATGG